MTAPVASTEVITMLAISQKPELVSNIFCSSTAGQCGAGWVGAARARGATLSTAMAVMLLLLLVGCLR